MCLHDHAKREPVTLRRGRPLGEVAIAAGERIVEQLASARSHFRNVSGAEGIAFCHFTEVDVVRHPLVQGIIVRYELRDRERKG